MTDTFTTAETSTSSDMPTTAAPVVVASKAESSTTKETPSTTKRVAKRPRIVDWECPICFKTSEESGVVVATLNGCRLTGCLLCMDCATDIMVHAASEVPEQQPRCPQCSATFTEARPLAAFVDQSVEESAAKLAKTIQEKSEVLTKETVAAELEKLRAFIDTCGSLRCSGCKSFCNRLVSMRNFRTKQVREAFEKSHSSGRAANHAVTSVPEPARSEQRRQSILPDDNIISGGIYYERPERRDHHASPRGDRFEELVRGIALGNALNGSRQFVREILGDQPGPEFRELSPESEFIDRLFPLASAQVLNLHANASTSTRPVQSIQPVAQNEQLSEQPVLGAANLAPPVPAGSNLDGGLPARSGLAVLPSSRNRLLRPFHDPVSAHHMSVAQAPVESWTPEIMTQFADEPVARYLAEKIIRIYHSRNHGAGRRNLPVHSFDVAVPEIDAGRVSLTVAGARGIGMQYNGRIINDRESLRIGLRRYAVIYKPIVERMIFVLLAKTTPFRIEVGNQWHPMAERDITARQVYMHYIIYPNEI